MKKKLHKLLPVISVLVTGCTAYQFPASGQAPVEVERHRDIRVIERPAGAPSALPDTTSNAQRMLFELASRQETDNPELAAATIERVLRVNPRSAQAYLRLAQLRVQINQLEVAEQLALKALTYANYESYSNNSWFKLEVWRLLLSIRKAQNNTQGVKEAETQIEKLLIRQG